MRLSVEARLINENKSVETQIVNTGDAQANVLRLEWRADFMRDPGRIALPYYPVSVNSRYALMLPQELVRGDVMNTGWPIESVAEKAHSNCKPGLNEEHIAASIRRSQLVCVTSTGEVFPASLPEAVQAEMLRRLQLLQAEL